MVPLFALFYLGLALGSPIFPSSCEGKLGIALQSLQGKINLIYACVQDLVFHYWANRDLRVASAPVTFLFSVNYLWPLHRQEKIHTVLQQEPLCRGQQELIVLLASQQGHPDICKICCTQSRCHRLREMGLWWWRGWGVRPGAGRDRRTDRRGGVS